MYVSADVNAGAKHILSGALTANTLATVLSITGAGVIGYLSISSIDATARTLRLQVTIDGVVAYDYTSASISSASAGIGVIGGTAQGAVTPSESAIPFNSSLVIKVASNNSETDKIGIGVKYRTC